jgi:hypothetical protein
MRATSRSFPDTWTIVDDAVGLAAVATVAAPAATKAAEEFPSVTVAAEAWLFPGLGLGPACVRRSDWASEVHTPRRQT